MIHLKPCGVCVPGEIGQPRRHVLQTQMLHLDVGVPEALDALLQELQRQVRLIHRQLLTDRLDEDGVIRRDAQPYNTTTGACAEQQTYKSNQVSEMHNPTTNI